MKLVFFLFVVAPWSERLQLRLDSELLKLNTRIWNFRVLTNHILICRGGNF